MAGDLVTGERCESPQRRGAGPSRGLHERALLSHSWKTHESQYSESIRFREERQGRTEGPCHWTRPPGSGDYGKISLREIGSGSSVRDVVEQ